MCRQLETASRAVGHPGASRDHPRPQETREKAVLPQPRRSRSHRGGEPRQELKLQWNSASARTVTKAGGNEERECLTLFSSRPLHPDKASSDYWQNPEEA